MTRAARANPFNTSLVVLLALLQTVTSCQNCLTPPRVGPFLGRPFSSASPLVDLSPIHRDAPSGRLPQNPLFFSTARDTKDFASMNKERQNRFLEVAEASTAAITIAATPSNEILLAQALITVLIFSRFYNGRKLPTNGYKAVLVTDGSEGGNLGSQEEIRKKRTLEEVLGLDKDEGDIDGGSETKEKDEKPVSAAMIATIGVYKNFISPLLPPACRFVPTCSQYGVQAIEEFGPVKGVTLTAWRLLRCSPIGGKGYDPPKWPPVSYTYSSY